MQATERHIFWEPWYEPGLEHLAFVRSDSGIFADSLVLRVQEGRPLRLHYRIRCDALERVRTVDIKLLDGKRSTLTLQSDGAGNWTDGAGEPVPVLTGCFEVDISATPFTNTLAIRRLQLQPGAAADLHVAYIAVPELRVESVAQRYTCLERTLDGGCYTYAGLFRGFTADLPVDADGIVFDYPETFRRVTSR
ncbi:MAG: putative glycolipid-binding domain-containing protein [Chloroflexaceae bacterium]